MRVQILCSKCTQGGGEAAIDLSVHTDQLAPVWNDPREERLGCRLSPEQRMPSLPVKVKGVWMQVCEGDSVSVSVSECERL